MPDKKLKDIMLFLKEIDNGYPLTEREREELSQIQVLDGWLEDPFETIPRSITLLTNLKILNLAFSCIQDISAIAGMPKLEYLDLRKSQVVDITGLTALPSLKKLVLNDTKITKIDNLSALPCLEDLDLSATQITDIGELASLKTLRKLDLEDTLVTDLRPLSGLTQLESLDLNALQAIDLKPLSEVTSLTHLSLQRTSFRDLSVLPELPNLKILELNDSMVTALDGMPDYMNLQRLDLSNTQIKTLFGMPALINLKYLALAATKINSLDGLPELPQLQELDLEGAWIADITGLSNSPRLQNLDLSNTKIVNLKGFPVLPNLKILDLSETKLTSLAGLPALERLEMLALRHTPLNEIDAVTSLSSLQELQLGGSSISKLDALSGLTQLKELFLWKTNITSLNAISDLTNITSLSVWGTNLTEIDALENWKYLEWLDISHTQIVALPFWLGKAPCLKRLDLSGLKLHSIPKDLLELNLPFFTNMDPIYESREKGHILIEDISIATQPVSLFEQPQELIRAYYDAPQIPINEAKVIFLGDGGAGKTHTIQRILNGGRKDRYETETTPGIDITNYAVDRDGRKFNIHFWDFGGQEIMHAMHRCFLTDRTCYVVVVSNRWDLNSRARYWLKNIDSFAQGAPVLLAVNRWDNIQETGIDMSRLTKDYPSLVKQPVYYSAKDSADAEFKQLMDAIVREAGKLDSSAMSFPSQWAAIRQQLLDMAEERYYIDKEEYHQICNQQGLDSSQIRTWLLEWFNDLGVCFSYHQDEAERTELTSYKVLNPRWLTNAIYIIINAGKRYADKGRMNLNLIQDLLKHSEFGVLPGVTYS